jgi:hypothetical protein
MMLHGRGELGTSFRPLPPTGTHHAPCQQHGHGIGKPALALMAVIPELRVSENDSTGGGVAGTYRLKQVASIGRLPHAPRDAGELSRRLGRRRPAVFLDYDETLTPIVDRPEER